MEEIKTADRQGYEIEIDDVVWNWARERTDDRDPEAFLIDVLEEAMKLEEATRFSRTQLGLKSLH
jgi:hypothetical protein